MPQCLQASSDVPPTWSLYFPVAQFLQAAAVVFPACKLYFPAAQFVQAAVAFPALCTLYFPATQFLQAVFPSSSLYFPAPQSVQMPELMIQYDPAGQHAETAMEPSLTESNMPSLFAALSTHVGLQSGS
jgi:hypothetical protein